MKPAGKDLDWVYEYVFHDGRRCRVRYVYWRQDGQAWGMWEHA